MQFGFKVKIKVLIFFLKCSPTLLIPKVHSKIRSWLKSVSVLDSHLQRSLSLWNLLWMKSLLTMFLCPCLNLGKVLNLLHRLQYALGGYQGSDHHLLYWALYNCWWKNLACFSTEATIPHFPKSAPFLVGKLPGNAGNFRRNCLPPPLLWKINLQPLADFKLRVNYTLDAEVWGLFL